jgi:hypothetical protein
MRTGRDTRNAIKNLDAAGGATRKRSTLVVMWNSVLDRRLEQGLPVNHLDSEFMRVSDSMHCHGRKALNVSAKQALDVFRRSLRFHSEATCALNPFMDDVIAEDFYGYPLDQQTNWVHVVVLVSWR